MESYPVHKINQAIAECDAFIAKEGPRAADLRPAAVAAHLKFCIDHRAKLIGMLEAARGGAGKMETKFTKGPWVAKQVARDWGCGLGWGVIATEPMRGRIDSQITGMTEADARLCAAAPDMFEALEFALSALLEDGHGEESLYVKRARAARAKARGQ